LNFRLTSAAAALAAALAAGCFGPRQPAEPRYFTPLGSAAAAPDPKPRADAPSLRLRRVRAAPYLRERMVWRRGPEVGYYDMLRWTETPARFAQRSLDDQLYEKLGFRRSSSPTGPTLDATLESFDELLDPAHESWVALAVVLSDPARGTLLDKSFEVRRPIKSDDPGAVADAIGEALDAASAEVGAAVAQALGTPTL